MDHFAAAADVYVAANMMVYHEEGNPTARHAPGLFVARGVGKHRRQSFRVWEEGTRPQVVFELALEETWREALEEKRDLYSRMGVREYFLFDPEGCYLVPVLQGFRYEGATPVPLRPAAAGSLESLELGLRLVPEDGLLRLVDANTGQPILSRVEQFEQEKAEAKRRKARLRTLPPEEP